MTVLRVTTVVHAPIELVFDLARDVGEHTAALAHTAERAVPPGRTSGRLEEGDLVCFRARHFGLPMALTARVVELRRPERFVDEQVRGAFRSLRHTHLFAATGGGTLVTDVVEWRSPLGPVGVAVDALVLRRHLLGILTARNAHLKRRAEVLALP
ncbi:MAG TPA: SRPBCC family protein [Mycobacteriales bacterium]|nr:SRPBCC family protein [Mycobacteriales bacterium]